MSKSGFRVYSYRWVVLFGFMTIISANQLLWITFAAITSQAVDFYHVSELGIGLLSLSFMVVYIAISFPASWVIDKYGIRIGVGIGAALTGIFGVIRGLVAPDYTGVLIAQIGIAVGQPFILNAITTVAGHWFPKEQRATASGLGSFAIYLGILAGLALTPYLVLRSDMRGMLEIYAFVSAIAMLIFLISIRERPPSPPSAGEQPRSLMLGGLSHILRQRDFVVLLAIFFVGLGAFNAITTWIEQVLVPRGFSATQAGDTGGAMIIGGIIGAVVIPLLSDRSGKRVPFLLTALLGAIVGLTGLTYSVSYVWLLISSFIFGFFMLSAGPLGFQYAAEITSPTPEGTSNGLLLFVGQVSGIAFILGMDALKAPSTGSMELSLLMLIGLMTVSLLMATRLGEAGFRVS